MTSSDRERVGEDSLDCDVDFDCSRDIVFVLDGSLEEDRELVSASLGVTVFTFVSVLDAFVDNVTDSVTESLIVTVGVGVIVTLSLLDL